MIAYYYCIFEDKTSNTILEGIIKDPEDTIYPQQETGIKELPYECEAHHFQAKGYSIIGFNIDIPIEDIHKYKI